jgi:hypothetical protein
MKINFLFFLLSLLFISYTYLDPSVRIAFNKNKLLDIEQIIINNLLSNISLSIEPIDLVQKIDLFGTIEFNISYPKVYTFSLNDFELNIDYENISDNNFIYINFTNFEFMFNFLYNIDSNFYHSMSYLNLTVSNVTFYLNLSLNFSVNKYEPFKNSPKIIFNEIYFDDFPTFDFVYYNISNNNDNKKEIIINDKKTVYMNSYIITNFWPRIKDLLLNTLISLINKDFMDYINDEIKTYTEKLFLYEDIIDNNYTKFHIDFSMNECPFINDNDIFEQSLDIYISSNITDKKYIRNYTYILPHIYEKDFDINNSIIVNLGKDIIDNNIFVLYHSRYINFFIDENTFEGFKLQAFMFMYLIPEIYNKFNLSEIVKVNITAFDIPYISFNNNDYIKMSFYEIIEFIIQDKIYLSFNCTIDFELLFSIKEGVFEIKIENSNFTDINIMINELDCKEDDLKKNFNSNVELIRNVLNLIMKYILQNFEIPDIYGIKIKNANFDINEEYLKIGITPQMDTFNINNNFLKNFIKNVVNKIILNINNNNNKKL